jgi:predicted ester cyclase
MSAVENKAIYLRVVEDLNRGDLGSSLEFTATDATLNGQPLGREGDRHRAEILATAFPDQRYDILELVAEGDMLVVRWRLTGTHKGELAGPTMTIPPTGERIDIWGMSMYRIEDGLAREIWERFDMMEFLGQLGVLPRPGQVGEASPT